jgi:hypothetical protein
MRLGLSVYGTMFSMGMLKSSGWGGNPRRIKQGWEKRERHQ